MISLWDYRSSHIKSYTVEDISPAKTHSLCSSQNEGVEGERSAGVTGESVEVRGLTDHTGQYLLACVSFQKPHQYMYTTASISNSEMNSVAISEFSNHHHGCRVILIRILFYVLFFQKPIGRRLTGCPVPIGSSRTHFLYDHLRRITTRDQ